MLGVSLAAFTIASSCCLFSDCNMARNDSNARFLSRREFLRTTAVATAAMTAPLIIPARLRAADAPSNRIRVGMATPQPLGAEITGPSARELALEPGARVVATWKAAATRVLPL